MLFIIITLLALCALYAVISHFVWINDMNEYERKRRGGDLTTTDYGCREDFSQRFEDDPWSMFRG